MSKVFLSSDWYFERLTLEWFWCALGMVDYKHHCWHILFVISLRLSLWYWFEGNWMKAMSRFVMLMRRYMYGTYNCFVMLCGIHPVLLHQIGLDWWWQYFVVLICLIDANACFCCLYWIFERYYCMCIYFLNFNIVWPIDFSNLRCLVTFVKFCQK